MTQPRISAEEFLVWDAWQTGKHEFVRGELLPKHGDDERHNVTAGNVVMALRAHLRGTACRTLAFDMKLRVEPADCFY